MPGWRNAIEEADTRALAALADCYDGGVPLPEALELAIAAGAGGRVGFDLHRALPRVRDGVALAACWQALPDDLAGSLRAGEEAGELGDAARHLAERLRFEVRMRRRKLAGVLPLGVLLVAGAVIAYRVIRFYADLYGNLPGM